MHYNRYISEIRKFKYRNVELDKSSKKILHCFTTGNHVSAYRVYSILNKSGTFHIDYINVNKKIQTLFSLNLIEKPVTSNTTRAINKPIFYRLTTGGIFHLLCRGKGIVGKEIFDNYGSNIIFETLVYPFFERSTIHGFNDENVGGPFIDRRNQRTNDLYFDGLFPMIWDYLSHCCENTQKIIESLDREQVKKHTYFLPWNSERPDSTPYFLQRDLGLNLEKGSIEIEEVKGKKRSIRISWGEYSLFTDLSKRNRKAILTVRGEILPGLDIRVRCNTKGFTIIYHKNHVMEGDEEHRKLHAEYIEKRKEHLLENLGDSIDFWASRLVSFVLPDLLREDNEFRKLIQDEKFMDLIKRNEKESKQYYDLLHRTLQLVNK